jgi:uncharacterized membrane protein HdeD (DUF308 family)
MYPVTIMKASPKRKMMDGILLLILGLILFIPWIISPGKIYALVSLLIGVCFFIAGILLIERARNEKFKEKYGEDIWYPPFWKSILVFMLLRIIVFSVISLIAFLLITTK